MDIEREEKEFIIGFSAFPLIGPKRFQLLRNFFPSFKKAWLAEREELLEIGFPEKLVENFVVFRKNFDLSSYILRLEKLGIKTKFVEDEDYPKSLKDIDGSPFLIYMLGEIIEEDLLSIGVVGTRKVTAYGKEVTEHLTADLVTAGVTIVSGIAYGVDYIAHQTALENSGRTIGVWAGGIDSLLVGFRKSLVARGLNLNKGVFISEYPLGFHPTKTTFPQRNRLIAGLSLGVLVTEAAEDSGSLITAEHALKQGKKVFAVPGPITSPLSLGTSNLIKKGAKLVASAKDILDELNVKENLVILKAKEILPESKEEELILRLLENEARHIDEIIRQTGMEVSKATGILSLMEMKGKIKNLGGMVYARNR